MANTPHADEDEPGNWLSLEAATRNAVAFLRSRNGGRSGKWSAATPTGGAVGEEVAAVPQAGGKAAAESVLKASTQCRSTAFQQSTQSTIRASTRRKAGDGHLEHCNMGSAPDEDDQKHEQPEQGRDRAESEKEKAKRDYVARRLADIAAFERRTRGEK